jgi:nucleoside-diphosphate-sugar epimerase
MALPNRRPDRTVGMKDAPAQVMLGRPVLVTGGAGFIGSHLVDALVAMGASVRVLDDLSTGLLSNLAPVVARIEVIEASLLSRDACAAACDGVDFIYHQAALGSVPRSLVDPASTIAANVSGTANLLAAARDASVRRVVYASSSSVYGDSQRQPRREGEEGTPLSPYALSKQMTELLAAEFGRDFALETVGLRYFNVYGPRQRPDGPYAAVVPRFFAAAAAGEQPTIYGDGEQSRDFTFVGDAVNANLLAATASPQACGRAFNVGGGHETSVNELARAIRSLAGGPAPHHQPPRAGDVRQAVASLEAVATALGYAPTVALAAGLAATFSAPVNADPRVVSKRTP